VTSEHEYQHGPGHLFQVDHTQVDTFLSGPLPATPFGRPWIAFCDPRTRELASAVIALEEIAEGDGLGDARP
jgi:hypothetical protein